MATLTTGTGTDKAPDEVVEDKVETKPKVRKRRNTEFEEGRDPRVERFIESFGVTWQFMPDINIRSMIDVEQSLQNQARFEEIDDEVVKRYTRYLLDGVKLPPIIVYPPSGQRLVNIDGNHRVVAHLEAAEEDPQFDIIAGYLVVGASPQTISTMTIEANKDHGKATSTAERIHHAVWLVQTGGMSAAKAAERLGIEPNHVRKAVNREKNVLRAHRAGITAKEWDRLGQFAQDRLSAIRTDEGLRAAAKLVLAAQLRQPEINELVVQANVTSSGRDQKKIIEGMALGYADRIEALAGGVLAKGATKAGLSPKQRILLSVGNLTSLPEDPAPIVAMFKAPEIPEVRARLSETIHRLQLLDRALAGNVIEGEVVEQLALPASKKKDN